MLQEHNTGEYQESFLSLVCIFKNVYKSGLIGDNNNKRFLLPTILYIPYIFQNQQEKLCSKD